MKKLDSVGGQESSAVKSVRKASSQPADERIVKEQISFHVDDAIVDHFVVVFFAAVVIGWSSFVVVGSFVVSVVVLFIRLQRSRIEALSRFLNLNRSIFPENYDFSLALP